MGLHGSFVWTADPQRTLIAVTINRRRCRDVYSCRVHKLYLRLAARRMQRWDKRRLWRREGESGKERGRRLAGSTTENVDFSYGFPRYLNVHTLLLHTCSLFLIVRLNAIYPKPSHNHFKQLFTNFNFVY